ncbi:MAG: LemA family protein [Bacteroidales bacterium]|nr:LemA family protein [Bacteroidales bacterium]
MKQNKTLWIVLAVVAVLLIAGVTSYNGLVNKDEMVNNAWANVQAQYQRRADLIPNLVNTVKGYAAHEKETLDAVIAARSKATQITIDPMNATPEQLAKFQSAQGELSQALGRLLALSENYPDLKASQNFSELQAQLEGTENRIAVSRQDFNKTVQEYNQSVRSFPTNILAGIFGFEKKTAFEADAAASQAPSVSF